MIQRHSETAYLQNQKFLVILKATSLRENIPLLEPKYQKVIILPIYMWLSPE